MEAAINTAKLGNWLNSWVQEDGAINGFHNHSVWGSNPYRLLDFTSEHTTFASPFLVGVAKALSLEMNEQGKELLNKLVEFQATSFQENSQYEHVGYQVGETLHTGLIHNAIANVSLLLTLEYSKEFLEQDMIQKIGDAVIKNLSGTMGWGGGRPCKASCCNQDYARIWSKLLYQRLFENDYLKEEIVEDIDYMINQFHVKGFPDEESIATYRNITLEQNTIEPTEYYGLMINPLIEAYDQYGDKKYLDEAIGICRHVVRSSWVDENNQRRFHKMYVRANGKWSKIKDTMLISGMALTLRGIKMCLKHFPNDEMQQFLDECNKTYEYYQTKRGYFVAATGWYAEADVAPCTAWQSHDFMYLLEEQEQLSDDFWKDFFSKDEAISILVGHNCVWVEDNTYWAIKDYFGSGLYMVAGRKDDKKFVIDIGWIPSNRQVDEKYKFKDCPMFYNFEDAIKIDKVVDRELLVDSIVNKKIEY